MEALISALVQAILAGGPAPIVILLLIVIAALIIDRKRLLEDLARKDAKIEKIVNDYYAGNTTLTEALGNLRLVLTEIKGNLR